MTTRMPSISSFPLLFWLLSEDLELLLLILVLSAGGRRTRRFVLELQRTTTPAVCVANSSIFKQQRFGEETSRRTQHPRNWT